MKAVIFDFNGTLYNDTRFHHQAWKNYMLKKFGMDLSEEEISAHYIGPNNREIFHYVFGEQLTEEEVERFSLEKEEEYRAVCRSKKENLQLMDGAPELFDYLEKKGIPFGLATASCRDNIDFYISDLGLGKWFTMDRIVYDEGILPSKPDPAFYLEAARRLGVKCEDCLIFEDSCLGIEAATRANAGRLVVIDRTTPAEKLKAFPNIHATIHDYFSAERFVEDFEL